MARGDFPSAKQDQYMLRFPDGMRDRLKASAANNQRSLNAEIVDRLERSLANEDEQASLHEDVRRLIAFADEQQFYSGMVFKMIADSNGKIDQTLLGMIRDIADNFTAGKARKPLKEIIKNDPPE